MPLRKTTALNILLQAANPKITHVCIHAFVWICADICHTASIYVHFQLRLLRCCNASTSERRQQSHPNQMTCTVLCADKHVKDHFVKKLHTH